jgi:hypothetical protein
MEADSDGDEHVPFTLNQEQDAYNTADQVFGKSNSQVYLSTPL